MSPPEIDHFLAAVVDGAGSPQLTSLGEVAFKLKANILKFRRRESFDGGWCTRSFRHLNVLLLWGIGSNPCIPRAEGILPIRCLAANRERRAHQRHGVAKIGQEMGVASWKCIRLPGHCRRIRTILDRCSKDLSFAEKQIRGLLTEEQNRRWQSIAP